MNRLEDKHIEFLRQCAEKPLKVHESDLPIEDLDQMVKENLLIKYGAGLRNKYSISRYGTQYVKERLSTKDAPVLPEMRAAALKYVMSKNYDEADANDLIAEWGVPYLLDAEAKEMRAFSQQVGQKDVAIPMNAQGKPEIKFRKG